MLATKQAGQQLQVQYHREGVLHTTTVTLDDKGKLGIALAAQLPYQRVPLSLLRALRLATFRVGGVLALQAQGIAHIVRRRSALTSAFTGPIGIARLFDTSEWPVLLQLLALLSIILAFMNLLPIPGLDGGHVALLLYEMLRGKPLSLTWRVRLQNVGTGLLFLLMSLALWNDVRGLWWASP